MPPKPRVRLSRKGVGQALHNMAPAVNALAAELADKIRADHPDLDIGVLEYSTDRAAASVLVRDSRGKELQLSEGLLTKAAGAIGLEVKAR